MADLTGTTPADTYKGLLQVNDYTDGIAGNTGSNALVIQDGAGNATALAISTDNVGIGTTSPDHKLTIQQDGGGVFSQYRDSSNYAGQILGDAAGIFGINGRTGVDISISGSQTSALKIDSDGNVGIGTTNPALTGLQLGTALVVSSSTGGDIVAHKSGSSVNVGDICGSLLIANSDTDGAEDHFAGMWGKVSSTNGSQDLRFAAGRSGYEGDAPHMTIDSDGNVGIGTTSPTNALNVIRSSTSGVPVAWLHNSNNTVAGNFGTVVSCINNDASINVFQVRSNNSTHTNGNGLFTVKGNGNVGVGTSSFGTSAIGVIGLANGIAPTSSPADMVQLYAEDVTASSELRVRDEAGNVTTLSPHAKDAPDSLYDNGKGVDEMHRVANHYLGTIVFTNIDRRNDLMQKQLNGEELPEDRTFKVTETFAEYNARTGADLQVEDWDANQQAMFDAQEEKVAARQAEIDAWDNEEEEAPEPLQSYIKKPKPDWLS